MTATSSSTTFCCRQRLHPNLSFPKSVTKDPPLEDVRQPRKVPFFLQWYEQELEMYPMRCPAFIRCKKYPPINQTVPKYMLCALASRLLCLAENTDCLFPQTKAISVHLRESISHFT